jgi:hypothetical protein
VIDEHAHVCIYGGCGGGSWDSNHTFSQIRKLVVGGLFVRSFYLHVIMFSLASHLSLELPTDSR